MLFPLFFALYLRKIHLFSCISEILISELQGFFLSQFQFLRKKHRTEIVYPDTFLHGHREPVVIPMPQFIAVHPLRHSFLIHTQFREISRPAKQFHFLKHLFLHVHGFHLQPPPYPYDRKPMISAPAQIPIGICQIRMRDASCLWLGGCP